MSAIPFRQRGRSMSLAAVALLGSAALSSAVPIPRHLREILTPRRDDPHTGDACPKCSGRRVWISGETLRCRDCGTRFIPDDLPAADE